MARFCSVQSLIFIAILLGGVAPSHGAEPSDQLVLAKLDAITLPELSISNQSLKSVLMQLVTEANKADSKLSLPAIDFVISEPELEGVKVALKSPRGNFAEVLNKLCQNEGLLWKVRDGRVVIFDQLKAKDERDDDMLVEVIPMRFSF